MFKLYIPDSPAINPRVANMADPAITNFTIGCIHFSSFQTFRKSSRRKKKGGANLSMWKTRAPFVSFLVLS